MGPSAGELASFLRAHRARMEPASVGLPVGGDRRVAGLRREEALDLYNAVVDEYPDRLNRGVLWNSARAVKG